MPVGRGGFIFPGVIFLEERKELFQVEFAVLAIKVQDEGDWSDAEELDLFGLAKKLEVFDERILGRYLMIELEVIDYSFAAVPPHFLEVIFVLVEDPLKVGETFSLGEFLPAFSLQEQLFHEFFVVVASDY